jgi:hypothetical protein
MIIPPKTTVPSIGIDYSMGCPAACAYQPELVQFYYAHATKDATFPNVTYAPVPSTQIGVQRSGTMAWDLLEWLMDVGTESIMIEDYAFAATGRVFHIGEHAGILKYVLMQNRITVNVVPPTVVKKFATGKGNADKAKMTIAFLADYPAACSWVTSFFPRYKDGDLLAKSPLSDLADAYWIAKYTNQL